MMIFGHVYELVRGLEDRGRVEYGVNAVLGNVSISLLLGDRSHDRLPDAIPRETINSQSMILDRWWSCYNTWAESSGQAKHISELNNSIQTILLAIIVGNSKIDQSYK